MKLSPRVLLLGAAVIVAVVVGVFVALNFSGGKVYGRVGSYKVTETMLKNVTSGSKFASKEQIITAILDNRLNFEIAKDNKIAITKDEVDQKLRERTLNPANIKTNNYLRIAAERDVYKEKIEQALQGYYKGQYVVARFDQHIYVKGGTKSREQASLTASQVAALQVKDREYATNFINNLSEDLKANKIDFSQAMQRQLEDPKFGIKAAPTALQSGSFNTSDSNLPSTDFFQQAQIQSALTSLSPGKVSQPVLGKVESGVKRDAPKLDGMWLLIKVTESRRKIAGFKNFDSIVSTYKSKLNYRLSL